MSSFDNDPAAIVSSTIETSSTNTTNSPLRPPKEGGFRDIVAQLRSGQKDKSEAFNDIKNMIQSTRAKNEAQAQEAAAAAVAAISTNSSSSSSSSSLPSQPETEEDTIVAPSSFNNNNNNNSSNRSGNSPPISADDRRQLISQLAETARKTEEIAQAELEALENESQFGNSTIAGMSEFGSDRNQRPESDWMGGEIDTLNMSQSSMIRRSLDDSNVNTSGDVRAQRIAQAEAAIRQEMFKECTFKPQIKKLPNSYGATKDAETPFYTRVSKWQKEKEADANKRKQFMDHSEVVDCTFRPRINRSSEKVVKELRGENSVENANDRLYKSSEVAYQQRAKFIEEELRREREEEDLECTFQPSLITSSKSKYADVKSKFELPADRGQDTNQTNKIKHSFQPKVNGVKSHMSAAQLYVSTNIVERLTRGTSITAGNNNKSSGSNAGQPAQLDDSFSGDRPVMDIASFMGSLQGGGNNNKNSSIFHSPIRGGKKETKRPSTAPKERSVELTADEIKLRQQNFENFIGRQNLTVMRKEKLVEETKKINTPKFKPQLCQKSLEMSEQHFKGEFLERLEKDVMKRSDNEAKLQASSPDKSQYTFKPEITSKSEKLRSRSVTEMSSGDLLRKETNHRMMRMRCEQEEMAELTFQPEISKMAHSRKSKLSLSDPSQALELHRIQEQKLAAKRSIEMQRRADQETEECTFTPKTKECPAYVKRIAKSMAVVKAARSLNDISASEKPLWK